MGSDPRWEWAFILGFRSLFANGKTHAVNLRLILAAMTFFIVCGVVLRLNVDRIPPDDGAAAWTFFKYFLAGAVFIFAASRFVDSREEAVRVLTFLGIAAAEVALYGIWQGYELFAGGQFDRVGSTLINPNALASFLGMSVIALISTRKLVDRRGWKIFIWPVIVMASFVVLLSLSRAGIMALLVGFILVWATAGGRFTAKRAAIVGAVASLVLFSSYALVRAYRIGQGAAQLSEGEEARVEVAQSMEDFTRYEAATFSLQRWSEHPLFGIGFSTLAAVNYQKNGLYITTHNTILQLFVGTGLFGLALSAYTISQLWKGLEANRVVFLPAAGFVAINSFFIDLLGALEMMAAISVAYLACRRFADSHPATSPPSHV